MEEIKIVSCQIIKASPDGVDVVFTYSDDTTFSIVIPDVYNEDFSIMENNIKEYASRDELQKMKYPLIEIL